MNIDRSRLSVMAHRGASAYAPENTMAAFRLAFDQGAPAVEFDVKLTSDREIIIHHDSTVDRTTDGTGRVHKKSLAELRELDAGSKFSEKFRGEKIPLLREVIEEFGSTRILNIELTNYVTPWDGLVYEVVKLVHYYGVESTVLFSSFNPINLWLAKKIAPTIACGYLRSQLTPLNQGISKFSSLQADHPIKQIVTPRHVQNAHDIGRQVYVWTVNEQTEMQDLKKMGVDGIITNDPVLGLEVFK